jgi:hypothetical protein
MWDSSLACNAFVSVRMCFHAELGPAGMADGSSEHGRESPCVAKSINTQVRAASIEKMNNASYSII